MNDVSNFEEKFNVVKALFEKQVRVHAKTKFESEFTERKLQVLKGEYHIG